MGMWSEINASHREAADAWDQSRVELESEEDPRLRMAHRLWWFTVFIGGFGISFTLGGLIGLLVTLGSNTAAWAGSATADLLFTVMWISVWIRSYTFKEDGVDLSK